MIKIENIYWERANLHFLFDKKISQNLYITKNNTRIKLEKLNDKDFYINITNTNGTMLNAGNWFLSCDNTEIKVNKNIYTKTGDLSRNFKYRSNLYAYLVNFYITPEEEIKISTEFMMINHKPKSFFRLSETKSIKRKIKIIINIIAVHIANLFYKTIRLFKIGKKNILFLTENSNELTWNLKTLYEYTKANRKEKIKIYSEDKYKNKKNPLSFLKEIIFIAQSDYIFVDNYTPILTHLKLNKKVKLIQLWHAGIGFKAVGYARFGLEGSPHPYKSCHRNYTDAIVDQPDLIKIYQEVFGTKEKIFKSTGIPRLNNYLDKSKIDESISNLEKINTKFKNKKVILFSPTYRGTGSKTAYYDFELLNFEEIYNFCKKNDFIFVIKNHPFIKTPVKINKKYDKYIYDYSTLDINDLIYISDIMITDYSSCAYEYSLFNRPLIFFRFDKEFYEYDRPMHTVDKFTKKQYEVRTFDELIKLLNELSKKIKIEDRFKNINKRNNNNSCETIIKEIVGD